MAGTRLIMLTAFDEKDQGQRAQKAGFSAYLTKPVRQHRLFSTLRAAGARGGPEPRQAVVSRRPPER